jgi:hypothetical protein
MYHRWARCATAVMLYSFGGRDTEARGVAESELVQASLRGAIATWCRPSGSASTRSPRVDEVDLGSGSFILDPSLVAEL